MLIYNKKLAVSPITTHLPLKYVAKLRDYWQGKNKLYLHMNMDAGHGGKSGRFRRYKEYALQYAFLLDLGGVKK